MEKHKLVFSESFGKLNLVINYLDVGARGDVGEPWSEFAPGRLKVIGFEPDPDEAARLSAAHPGRRYYPHGLWSGHGLKEFHLCEWASTSSMYPPNEEGNRQYLSRHWLGRRPARTLAVECVALDEVLEAEDAPDFIKIDTQGAELEILRGAENLLRANAPIVLTETWCAEVYKDIPLTHDVMAFMSKLGYQVFDLNIAAAWQHQSKALPESRCKAKTIGFDLLFIKQLERCEFSSVEKLLKFAGLCELYGFRDYAVAVLENSKFVDASIVGAIAQLVANERWEHSLACRVQRLLNRVLRRGGAPKLH